MGGNICFRMKSGRCSGSAASGGGVLRGGCVDVLAFMENHFHLLVHVLGEEPGDLEDGELLRRARLIYPKGEGIGRQPLSLELIEWALQSGNPEDRRRCGALLDAEDGIAAGLCENAQTTLFDSV